MDVWIAVVRQPRAVNGTILVESVGVAALRSTLRKVVDAEEPTLPTGNLQTDLAGADVRITMLQDGERGGAVMRGEIARPTSYPRSGCGR